MFGRNGRLPVDLIFNITTNNNIKNKPHSDFVRNLQNAVKEVYSKIHQNNEVLQTNKEPNYDKKIFVSTLIPGEIVLLKKISERGGTVKLRSYWENYIYKMISCHSEYSIY